MNRVWVLVPLLLAGCPSTGTPTPNNPDPAPADAAAAPPPEEAAASASDDPPTRVHVTAAEAEAHGLTPFDFSIDTAGTPMLATPFPEQGAYLTISGPPGGPQLLRFLSLAGRIEDPAALEPILRQTFSGAGGDPFVLGAPTEVTIGGSARQALPFATGQSMARTAWCAVLIDSRLRGAVPQLLVLAGIGSSGEPDCSVPLGNEQLAKVLESLQQE
jgi:hypothetical protein